MTKIKEYLNWQIMLIVFVNLFMANTYFAAKHLLGIPAVYLMFNYKNAWIVFFASMFICISRVIYLPVLYSFLENKSNNKLVKKFIYNLKNNKKFRIIFLIFVELPVFTIAVTGAHNGAYNVFSYLFNLCFGIFFSFCLLDLFGSYVFLFLWWKITGQLK